MTGPCCVLGATAPPADDCSPDAITGEGEVSDGSTSSDEDVREEQGGTSPSGDEEELAVAKIISHRDTRGDLNDPVNWYYTVCYAGLEELGEEAHEELPEEEALRRCRKLVRDYQREVRAASASAGTLKYLEAHAHEGITYSTCRVVLVVEKSLAPREKIRHGVG